MYDLSAVLPQQEPIAGHPSFEYFPEAFFAFFCLFQVIDEPQGAFDFQLAALYTVHIINNIALLPGRQQLKAPHPFLILRQQLTQLGWYVKAIFAFILL